jgi:energy-coupling factor transporter ATP-binding protein EcfA2
MGFTLEVDNYRALRKVRWSPSGVCAITGPNGSGKTTLLSALEFMRHIVERGGQGAADLLGGSAGLKHQHAGPTEPILLRLLQGEAAWRVQLAIASPRFFIHEAIFIGQEQVVELNGATGQVHIQNQPFPSLPNSAFVHAINVLPAKPAGHVLGLFRFAYGFRLYQELNLSALRTTGSPVSADLFLHSTGLNAFSLLRNWKAGRREDEERWNFVRSGLRECFPELFEDLEFQAAGQTVTVRFYFRGLREPVDAFSAPNGLLITLLHLCAIASAPDHGAVAIDEPENGLHPFAIRTLLELMRARATEKDLTVLLATHSPVVLNTFNTDPGRVYIMEPGHEVLPVPLDKHSNPEWLAHFALGDLYVDQAFGAQKRPPE